VLVLFWPGFSLCWKIFLFGGVWFFVCVLVSVFVFVLGFVLGCV